MKTQTQKESASTAGTLKVEMSLMSRLGIVAQYWSRKPARLKDIMISADIINKINPTDEQRKSWLQREISSEGTSLMTFTAEGQSVGPVEFCFSNAEAQDMLDLLNNVEFHVSDVKWALPLLNTLTAALAKEPSNR